MTQQITGPIGTPQARTGPMPTTGRWGWYRDHEGNEFRRVSTMVKKVETDNFNLEKWKLRQVAEGLAIRDDLVLAVKSMGRPNPVDGWTSADKSKLDGIAKDAMAAAKQRDGARAGTAYHDLTERLDRGAPLEAVLAGLPAGAAGMLRAYDYLRRENGWRVVEIERTVVCDELEVAGTFDRVDLVPGLAAMLGPGECQYGCAANGIDHASGFEHELPVVVDVKSEKDPTLNGLHIGPQLAIYSRARRMWRPTGGRVPIMDAKGEIKTYDDGNPIMTDAGEYVPAPCVRQDIAIVVHTTETEAKPYFINLTEGWEAAQAAYAQMNREARAKRKIGGEGAWFAEVPGVKLLPKPAPAQIAADRGGQRCLVCQQQAQAGDEKCRKCGNRIGLPAPSEPVLQESFRREDGMVDWRPAPAEPPVGARVEIGGTTFTKVDTVAAVADRGPLDDVDRQAVEAIWAASDITALARTFEIYTGMIGREWAGPVADAGAARRAQIDCGHRALHTGGKCACGWQAGMLP